MTGTQTQKLAELGKEVAHFAHDINNLLGFLIPQTGLIKKLMEGSRNGTGRVVMESSRAKDVVQGCERLLEILQKLSDRVNNVLVFMRKNGIRKGFSPNLVVSQSIIEAGGAARRKNILIEFEADEALLLMTGDPEALSSVVINLLKNAQDAMQGSGKIRVRTRQKGEEMVLEVRDEGIGIPAENLPHIFDPQFTTKPRGEGTGLGLSMVKDHVDKMGGEIRVSSRAGEGTTFTLTIPLRKRS